MNFSVQCRVQFKPCSSVSMRARMKIRSVDRNNSSCSYFCAGIGFTQSQFTVLEGESVDISIQIETSDGLPLDPAAEVTLSISDNVGSGNTAIDLNRLMGDISFNAQSDRIVTFTVPMGQASGSTISFTGSTIAENEALDGELQFVLVIEGFPLTQTSGGGIFGFTTVIVDDDDDGKSMHINFLHVFLRDTHAQRVPFMIPVRNFFIVVTLNVGKDLNIAIKGVIECSVSVL